MTLVAAADTSGGTAQADFYDGIFKLGQTKRSKPTTTLKLVEKLSCGRAGKASSAARKKKKRKLWGDGSGRFRTDGKHSAATVVGTKWLVEDRWWTPRPLRRHYFELALADGRALTVFRDAGDGRWFRQRA